MAVAVHDVVPRASVQQRNGDHRPERGQRRSRDHHRDDPAHGSAGAGSVHSHPARHSALDTDPPLDLARVLRTSQNPGANLAASSEAIGTRPAGRPTLLIAACLRDIEVRDPTPPRMEAANTMATASTLRSPASIRADREISDARPVAKVAYWLSGALAVVAAFAAGGTALVPGVLRGTAVMNGSARGPALVVLLIAVPALAIAMWFTARGSARAQIVWLGAVGYILYNSTLFLFMTPFNNLFLLYVAMLSLGIWSTAMVIRGVGVESFRERFSQKLPARAIAIYALAIVALNFLAWMQSVVPGVLSTSAPSFLDGTGMPTSVLYVQDLAFWLPLMAVSAVWLWRRQAWGYVISGAMLVTYEIEAVGVAVDQWMGHAADPASSVAFAAAVPLFAAIAVINLVPLVFSFRSLTGARGE